MVTSELSAQSTKFGYTGGLTCAMQVSDRKRAIAFYENVLGFKLVYDIEEIGWCELYSPVNKVQIGLSNVENLNVEGGTTLTFGVADIEVALAELKANDVKVSDITTYPGMVRLLTFYDPDGNHLMFYQSLGQE